MVSLPNIFTPDEIEQRKRLLNWYFMELEELESGPAADWSFADNLDLTGGNGPTLAIARTSGDASYFDSAGLLKIEASNNTARFTHDPATLVSRGVMSERASTNHALWCRDGTNAAWVKSNITPVKDATGLDGVGNSATTLTATAGNGTMLQTVTIASAAFTTSFWVKRKTGTGNIDITDNNGANWTTLTGLSSSWTRHRITRTQANPIFGFRIVTSGDEIEFDFAQMEPGSIPTSNILTTTTAVTRAIEQLATTDTSWFNNAEGTFLIRFSIPYFHPTGSVDHYIFNIDDGSLNNTLNVRLDMGFAGGRERFVLTSAAGDSSDNLGTAGNTAEGGDIKWAIAYKVDDVFVDYNNNGTDVDATFDPWAVSMTRANFGFRAAVPGQQLCGTIAEIKYWSSRESNAFVTALAAP